MQNKRIKIKKEKAKKTPTHRWYAYLLMYTHTYTAMNFTPKDRQSCTKFQWRDVLSTAQQFKINIRRNQTKLISAYVHQYDFMVTLARLSTQQITTQLYKTCHNSPVQRYITGKSASYTITTDKCTEITMYNNWMQNRMQHRQSCSNLHTSQSQCTTTSRGRTLFKPQNDPTSNTVAYECSASWLTLITVKPVMLSAHVEQK